MRSIAGRHLVALGAAVAVIACGEVPTLENGIAFISPVQLPAPAVAAGDTLRDSLGRVAPLSVLAYDRGNVVLSGITASFVVTTVPAGVTIDGLNRVVGLDSIRTVQLVGRIGDRLQTAAIPLEVVPQPDSMAATGTIDPLPALVASSALKVNVTGLRGGTRVGVKGIIVRYRIANVYPARAVDSSVVFFPNGRTIAVDTTSSNPGMASRTITLTSSAGLDSVAVVATANNLRGQPLRGSPQRFVVPVKKGT